MIECTVALVVKRVYEKQCHYQHETTKNNNQTEVRSKESTFRRRKNEHTGEAADQASNSSANFRIKKNSFLS